MTTEAEGNGQVPPDAAESPPADEQELQQVARTELSMLTEAARLATPERARAMVEALLFAAERPLDLAALQDATQLEEQVLKDALEALRQKHASGAGTVLVELGGRWQLRTDPELGAYLRRMLQVKPMRLTRAALETLAIVAYRQPVTRPEMEDLRGVDCGAVTKALLERKLIRILGKKDEPGRPLLYGTTREFLELFNLRDLTQLPTLREFQELSEESRKIVEEEAPPPVAGLTELAQDPQAAEKLARHTAESDTALSQLEDAMEDAEERSKATAQILAPPPEPTLTTSTPTANATPNATPSPTPNATSTSQEPADREPQATSRKPEE